MIQNVSDLIQFIFSGLIMSLTCHFMWIKLRNIDIKKNIFKILISMILLSIILIFNYYFINSYLKIIVSALCCFIIIEIFISHDIRKSVILTMYTEAIYILAEIFFSVIMLLFFGDNLDMVMEKYFGSLLTNFCISAIVLFLFSFRIFRKLYDTLLQTTAKIKIYSIIILTLVLIISINIFLAMPYYKVNTLIIVIVNSILLIIYTLIVLQFIQAKNRYIDINDKYSLTETSLKELQSNINRLMTVNHEHKNQLLTIRTMVANKDKDVSKNIDAIIDRKIKDDKELKIRTSVISNTMLGALVYSKLLTMKENNINYNIHIDKALSKSNFIKLDDKTNVDICKVVGVYLDNAIEAVNGIDVKEINIDLFLEDNYLYITIANTFDGNVDVNMLHDYGYTTKSEGHGYGLALVKEVIKENNNLDSETEIIDNVFIQKLKIKM